MGNRNNCGITCLGDGTENDRKSKNAPLEWK